MVSCRLTLVSNCVSLVVMVVGLSVSTAEWLVAVTWCCKLGLWVNEVVVLWKWLG